MKGSYSGRERNSILWNGVGKRRRWSTVVAGRVCGQGCPSVQGLHRAAAGWRCCLKKRRQRCNGWVLVDHDEGPRWEDAFPSCDDDERSGGSGSRQRQLGEECEAAAGGTR